MALSSHRKSLRLTSILVGLAGTALIVSAAAQKKTAPPDFFANGAGWVGLNGAGPFYEPVPGVVPAPARMLSRASERSSTPSESAVFEVSIMTPEAPIEDSASGSHLDSW